MIGCFPQPYPDELFYSICARFSDRMGYPTAIASVRELFGTHIAKAIVALPSHLSRLMNLLPPRNRFTVDDLIDKHTLLPFYGPFLPPERLQKVRNAMSGDRGGITSTAGITGGLIPLPMRLRFCPICVNEDIKQVGECYWHRVHQVSGVEVCPIHEIFLQNSDVRIRNARLYYDFASAEGAIAVSEVQRLDLSIHSHNVLLAIARDVLWLLGQRGLCHDRQSRNKVYAAALSDRGFTSYRGKVYMRELLEAFKTYYPSDLLKLLHCELQEKRRNTWISYLLNPWGGEQHPIHHLLLMHFLGYSVKNFFDTIDKLSLSTSFEHVFPTRPPNSGSSGGFSSSIAFGEGPWPCLNPVSDHYRKTRIQQCHVVYNSKHGGRPTGTFSCDCGFTYYRRGPDLTIEDRFRKSKVKSFGPTWESALRRLWEDSDTSLMSAARQLGVDWQTMKRQAARLGLSANRGRMKPLEEAQIIPSGAAKASTKLELYRATWQIVLKENPEAGAAALRSKARKAYGWLYKYDKEWLKAHVPVSKGRRKSLIDWNKRDAEFFEAVKASATRIKNTPGRPQWVTMTSICRDTGLPLSQRKLLTKLPLTTRLLGEVVETAETFAVRRVWSVAEQYKQENIYPTRSQLVKRSCLSASALTKWPQVNLAVDSALEALCPAGSSTSHGTG